MPEGVALAGGQAVRAGVHDDADSKPEPSAEAPRGWTWDRSSRAWKPKVKGRILWTAEEPGGVSDDGGGDAAAPGSVDDRESRDPAPSWAREDAKQDKRDQRKLRFADVPQDVKDDAAGLIGMVGAPILGMLRSIDPFCGGALADCFEPAVDAALPLMLRSSKIVRYFQDDSNDWLLWGKLAMALAPAGSAILQHHILRTVEVVRDKEGHSWVQPRQAEGQADHLQPKPQPEFRYAA